MDDQPSRFARWIGQMVGVFVGLRALARRGQPEVEPGPAPAPGPGPGPGPADDQFDPSQRHVPANRRAEALVAALLLLAALFGFGFTAIYIIFQTNAQLLGLAMGGALAMLAAAAIVAGKLVVPQETAVEQRGPLLEDRLAEEVTDVIESGSDGISRRVLLAGAGGVAGVAMITAAAAPLASLGPTLSSIHQTPWHAGVGLVDEQGQPLIASQIQVGSFSTALPEGGDIESFGAGLLVVRLLAEQIDLPAARRSWAPDGILAYSKICPHAGCAISLYRYPTYRPTSDAPAFTCPCHYSTFLPGDGGKVIFGPAGRPLPQLPLMIDPVGRLRAAGPFHEDIGPSWWGVHRAE